MPNIPLGKPKKKQKKKVPVFDATNTDTRTGQQIGTPIKSKLNNFQALKKSMKTNPIKTPPKPRKVNVTSRAKMVVKFLHSK